MPKIELTKLGDNEEREIMERRAARSALTVRSWFDCFDKKEADGSTTFASRLSPDFNSEQKAKQAFEKVENPSKYLGYMDRFFSPTRSGDIEERAEYLAGLH